MLSFLEQITELQIFHFMLIFCRMGAGIMSMPAVGESYVPMRIRFLIAALLTLVIFPIISNALPALPKSALMLAALIIGESFIGIFLGLLVRILTSVMHTAGMIIGYQTGLASALLFDPNTNSQGTAIGNYMTLLMVTLFFSTNLHHIFIAGITDSYHVFPAGNMLPIGDASEMILEYTSNAFLMALKISSPQIVIGLVMYLAAGVMSRLMPNMQVFFVLSPFQIALGFFVMVTTLSGMMMWYFDYLGNIMSEFFGR